MGTKNTMLDLNNHLFAELERLGEEDLKGEELEAEISRARAVADIGRTAISNAALVLRAAEFEDRKLGEDTEVPRMLTGDRDGRA